MRPREPLLLQLATVVAIAAAFTALAWSSQRGLGILWDEVVDRKIASGFLDHPLYGIGDDGSQMRLPMMVNAIAYAVSGPSLSVSRGVSVAVGFATVLATFLMCRRLFDAWTAVLACCLLGFSPYFLSFARIAMTEGDVFCALFVTLSCWGYVAYTRERSGPRLVVAATLLGLAIGAKLYALFLIPVFGLLEFVDARARKHLTGNATAPVPAQPMSGSPRWTVLAALGTILLAATSAFLAQARWVGASIGVWALLLAVTVLIMTVLLRGSRPRYTPAVGWAAITLLAVCVTCAAMPQHVLHPDLLRTIARRAASWDDVFPGSLWVDHLRLYSGIILFGPTVPVGLAALAAVVWAWIRENEIPRLRLPIFALTVFVLALTTLPLRQTFYLMTVWPLLMILTAAGLMAVRRWLTGLRSILGRACLVAIVILVTQQMVTTYRAWPDYNLYPRHWIGTTWLGAEARGYRNLIQTPCDGYAELVSWCLANARPGQRVVSYLWADHVLDELLPNDPPFTLVRRSIYQASNRGLPRPAPPAIDQADFLLLHVNNFVEYHDTPGAEALAKEFQREPVFVVRRDGDFAIAMIYKRRDDAGADRRRDRAPGQSATTIPSEASVTAEAVAD